MAPFDFGHFVVGPCFVKQYLVSLRETELVALLLLCCCCVTGMGESLKFPKS